MSASAKPPGPSSSEMIRLKVLEINRDANLTRAQKEEKIQRLMMSNWRVDHLPTASAGDSEDDRRPTYYKEEQLGCEHYVRGCKIRAACCGKLFPCRLCHNDVSTHEIDRYATTEIMCMRCQTCQPVAEKCINVECAATFARYFCADCKFYDDYPSKQIYHCPGCKMCRIGEGLGIDYFHCDTCNMCLNMSMLDNHICIERNMEASCPVCCEFMFTSTSSVTVLKNCGHAIHSGCLNMYMEASYNISCPVCSKSIGEMNGRWRLIDLALQEQPMPPEFAETTAGILCNDCNEKSTVPYHFLYHKCSHCLSYNTRIVTTENMPVFENNGQEGEGEHADESSEVEEG